MHENNWFSLRWDRMSNVFYYYSSHELLGKAQSEQIIQKLEGLVGNKNQIVSVDIGKQANNNDSGIFIIEALTRYFTGGIEGKEDIDPEYVRRRLITELYTGVLKRKVLLPSEGNQEEDHKLEKCRNCKEGFQGNNEYFLCFECLQNRDIDEIKNSCVSLCTFAINTNFISKSKYSLPDLPSPQQVEKYEKQYIFLFRCKRSIIF